jgi:hypothetical protein
MIFTSLFFGAIAAITSLILFMKLHWKIRDWLYDHPLIAEALSFLFVFTAITSVTSSLIGVFTALSAELLWSIGYFILRYKRY